MTSGPFFFRFIFLLPFYYNLPFIFLILRFSFFVFSGGLEGGKSSSSTAPRKRPRSDISGERARARQLFLLFCFFVIIVFLLSFSCFLFSVLFICHYYFILFFVLFFLFFLPFLLFSLFSLSSFFFSRGLLMISYEKFRRKWISDLGFLVIFLLSEKSVQII